MSVFSPWRRLAAVALTGFIWFSAGNASAADGKVSGKVQYEKILYRNPDNGVGGLHLSRPVPRPVVGAKVELVDAGKNVLAAGVTDARGDYHLSWSSPLQPNAQVRVLAAADNAMVVDANDPDSTYSVSSDAWLLPEGEAVKDIVATDKARESGPFNILAVIQIGNGLVRSVEPHLEFPQIRIHWTTRPRDGTTYFVPGKNEAHVLGYRDDDSDEFDDFIILHEYGHFLTFTFSRDNSPGGNHGRGDRLDPRLAWSEGYANFFACAALNDPLYLDTGANRFDGTNVRLDFNLDEDRPSGDRAGYWSEHSVGSTLWDLFDKRPGKLHLGLGFGEIWKVLRSKSWMDRPYQNLIDFCDVLVEMRPELGGRVAEVLAARGIKYNPGKSPSVAGPYVRPLSAGVAQVGEVNSMKEFKSDLNMLEAREVFTFTLTKKTKVKLHLEITGSKKEDKADLDLWLFGTNGRAIQKSDAANGVGGTETIEMELEAGIYYVEVQSWAPWTERTERGVIHKMVHNTGSFRVMAEY